MRRSPIGRLVSVQKTSKFVEAGETVAQLACPLPPLTGWKAVKTTSIATVGPLIPIVTNGMEQTKDLVIFKMTIYSPISKVLWYLGSYCYRFLPFATLIGLV